MIQDILGAFRFLTVFPFKAGLKSEESPQLARAMFYFPFVGLVIGSATLGVFYFAKTFLPDKAAVLFLVLLPVLLSGGIHVDGFADFCDGFLGIRSREEILRIMKDPRLGTWGVAGVVFLLLFKYELLYAHPVRETVFLAAMLFSRWAQVAMSYALGYGGGGAGLSTAVAGKITKRELIGASLMMVPALILLKGPGILLFLFLVLFLWLLGVYFKSRIGGVTGDLLGASSEMTELFVYFFSFAFLGGQG